MTLALQILIGLISLISLCRTLSVEALARGNSLPYYFRQEPTVNAILGKTNDSEVLFGKVIVETINNPLYSNKVVKIAKGSYVKVCCYNYREDLKDYIDRIIFKDKQSVNDFMDNKRLRFMDRRSKRWDAQQSIGIWSFRPEHSGIYSCVDTKINQTIAQTEITVVQMNFLRAFFEAEPHPEDDIPTTNTTDTSKHYVSISCEGNGYPEPDRQWLFNGTPINFPVREHTAPMFKVKRGGTKLKLRFRESLGISFAGNYTCLVNNSVAAASFSYNVACIGDGCLEEWPQVATLQLSTDTPTQQLTAAQTTVTYKSGNEPTSRRNNLPAANKTVEITVADGSMVNMTTFTSSATMVTSEEPQHYDNHSETTDLTKTGKIIRPDDSNTNTTRFTISTTSKQPQHYNNGTVSKTTNSTKTVESTMSETSMVDKATFTGSAENKQHSNKHSETTNSTNMLIIIIMSLVSGSLILILLAKVLHFRRFKEPKELPRGKVKSSNELNGTEGQPPVGDSSLHRRLTLQMSIDSHSPLVRLSSTCSDTSPELSVQSPFIFSGFPHDLSPKDLECLVNTEWEFPRERLTLGEHLGSGEFGQVWQALATNIVDGENVTQTAVKTLKMSSDNEQVHEFFREMSTLISVGSHANIVSLLGVCTLGGPPLIIMELCQNGNLLAYLRKKHTFYQARKKHLTEVYRDISSEDSLPERSRGNLQLARKKSDCVKSVLKRTVSELPWPITVTEIMRMAYQVASGMEYLQSQKCIHRDLAARNVLLTENNVLKVADFGLARSMAYLYKATGKKRFPVRWTAPEALFDHVFTAKSDVWAYGVVLWEITELGATPYSSIPCEDLFQMLQNGYRLPRPKHTYDQFYDLMLWCWEADADDRPTFTQIVSELEQLLHHFQVYLKLGEEHESQASKTKEVLSDIDTDISDSSRTVTNLQSICENDQSKDSNC